ncbi:hypothetical protein GCM10023335_54920 [Streptomyces siamensis]|uniref:Uncharacterized protein n=1 Tax=Streptomyces siamensis TaxID=1274986 RepID=A0ABP9J727_9ACTN
MPRNDRQGTCTGTDVRAVKPLRSRGRIGHVAVTWAPWPRHAGRLLRAATIVDPSGRPCATSEIRVIPCAMTQGHEAVTIDHGAARTSPMTADYMTGGARPAADERVIECAL